MWHNSYIKRWNIHKILFSQNKSQLVSIFQISPMQIDEMTTRPFGMPLALRVSCENDEAEIPPQVVHRKNR